MAVQQGLKQSGAYGGPTGGVWGPESAAALEQFQRAHGLHVTGQLNQATVATLGLNPADLLAVAPAGVPTASASAAEPLSRDAIRAVQSLLRQLGFYSGRIDGIWGPSMQASLQRFQQGRGLQATGAAESCNRDGAWSGSEQSCRSAGNCRPSPVTANPALVYLFGVVAAGRQTAPNSICKPAGPAPQELKARIAPEEKEQIEERWE
jgi:peptidoglycan hydrolase-like protein with peptidoglycan-binding domain